MISPIQAAAGDWFLRQMAKCGLIKVFGWRFAMGLAKAPAGHWIEAHLDMISTRLSLNGITAALDAIDTQIMGPKVN